MVKGDNCVIIVTGRSASLTQKRSVKITYSGKFIRGASPAHLLSTFTLNETFHNNVLSMCKCLIKTFHNNLIFFTSPF